MALAALFLLHDAVWAAPEIARTIALSRPLLSVKIPASVALIEDEHRADEKVIYLIQDAHTNESAQLNIAKALELLNARHVFLEAGSGDDSLTFLRQYGTRGSRQRAAKSYLKKGWIQGPDYLDLTSSLDLKLWGVEDKALYRQSVELYRALAKTRGHVNAYLDNIDRAIKTLKPRVYNPSLLEYDEKAEAFRKNGMPLTDYFEALTFEARKLNVPLGGFPNLRALDALRQKETAIDFEKANAEQSAAVASFSSGEQKSLADASVRDRSPFRLGAEDRREAKGFYAVLEEKLMRRDGGKYPELFKYFDYLRQSRKLDHSKLLSEQKDLERIVYGALVRGKDEKKLLEISEAAALLRKLLNLTATSAEVEAIERAPKKFDAVEISGFLNKKIMDLGRYHEDAIFLDAPYAEAIGQAKAFYRLTKERDRAFLSNALRKMRETGENRAVLVAGGYHAEHLKFLFRQNNISYVSILPQVLQETNQKRYESVLLGQALDGRAIAAGHVGVEPGRELELVVNGSRLKIAEKLVAELGATVRVPEGARLADDAGKFLTTDEELALFEALIKGREETPDARKERVLALTARERAQYEGARIVRDRNEVEARIKGGQFVKLEDLRAPPRIHFYSNDIQYTEVTPETKALLNELLDRWEAEVHKRGFDLKYKVAIGSVTRDYERQRALAAAEGVEAAPVEIDQTSITPESGSIHLTGNAFDIRLGWFQDNLKSGHPDSTAIRAHYEALLAVLKDLRREEKINLVLEYEGNRVAHIARNRSYKPLLPAAAGARLAAFSSIEYDVSYILKMPDKKMIKDYVLSDIRERLAPVLSPLADRVFERAEASGKELGVADKPSLYRAFQQIFVPVVENAIDAYLKKKAIDPSYDKPLKLDFYESAEGTKTHIRMASNGAPYVAGVRETEQKKQDRSQLGGQGEGLKAVDAAVRSMQSAAHDARWLLKDRWETMGDEDGAVFELTLELQNFSWVINNLKARGFDGARLAGQQPVSDPEWRASVLELIQTVMMTRISTLKTYVAVFTKNPTEENFEKLTAAAQSTRRFIDNFRTQEEDGRVRALTNSTFFWSAKRQMLAVSDEALFADEFHNTSVRPYAKDWIARVANFNEIHQRLDGAFGPVESVLARVASDPKAFPDLIRKSDAFHMRLQRFDRVLSNGDVRGNAGQKRGARLAGNGQHETAEPRRGTITYRYTDLKFRRYSYMSLVIEGRRIQPDGSAGGKYFIKLGVPSVRQEDLKKDGSGRDITLDIFAREILLMNQIKKHPYLQTILPDIFEGKIDAEDIEEIRKLPITEEQIAEIRRVLGPEEEVDSLAFLDLRDGMQFVATEEAEGMRLRDIIGEKNEQKSMETLQELVETVLLVHRHGYRLRDLDPNDEAFSKDGTIRLIDYGSSAHVSLNSLGEESEIAPADPAGRNLSFEELGKETPSTMRKPVEIGKPLFFAGAFLKHLDKERPLSRTRDVISVLHAMEEFGKLLPEDSDLAKYFAYPYTNLKLFKRDSDWEDHPLHRALFSKKGSAPYLIALEMELGQILKRYEPEVTQKLLTAVDQLIRDNAHRLDLATLVSHFRKLTEYYSRPEVMRMWQRGNTSSVMTLRRALAVEAMLHTLRPENFPWTDEIPKADSFVNDVNKDIEESVLEPLRYRTENRADAVLEVLAFYFGKIAQTWWLEDLAKPAAESRVIAKRKVSSVSFESGKSVYTIQSDNEYFLEGHVSVTAAPKGFSWFRKAPRTIPVDVVSGSIVFLDPYADEYFLTKIEANKAIVRAVHRDKIFGAPPDPLAGKRTGASLRGARLAKQNSHLLQNVGKLAHAYKQILSSSGIDPYHPEMARQFQIWNEVVVKGYSLDQILGERGYKIYFRSMKVLLTLYIQEQLRTLAELTFLVTGTGFDDGTTLASTIGPLLAKLHHVQQSLKNAMLPTYTEEAGEEISLFFRQYYANITAANNAMADVLKDMETADPVFDLSNYESGKGARLAGGQNSLTEAVSALLKDIGAEKAVPLGRGASFIVYPMPAPWEKYVLKVPNPSAERAEENVVRPFLTEEEQYDVARSLEVSGLTVPVVRLVVPLKQRYGSLEKFTVQAQEKVRLLETQVVAESKGERMGAARRAVKALAGLQKQLWAHGFFDTDVRSLTGAGHDGAGRLKIVDHDFVTKIPADAKAARALLSRKGPVDAITPWEFFLYNAVYRFPYSIRKAVLGRGAVSDDPVEFNKLIDDHLLSRLFSGLKRGEARRVRALFEEAFAAKEASGGGRGPAARSAFVGALRRPENAAFLDGLIKKLDLPEAGARLAETREEIKGGDHEPRFYPAERNFHLLLGRKSRINVYVNAGALMLEPLPGTPVASGQEKGVAAWREEPITVGSQRYGDGRLTIVEDKDVDALHAEVLLTDDNYFMVVNHSAERPLWVNTFGDTTVLHREPRLDEETWVEVTGRRAASVAEAASAVRQKAAELEDAALPKNDLSSLQDSELKSRRSDLLGLRGEILRVPSEEISAEEKPAFLEKIAGHIRAVDQERDRRIQEDTRIHPSEARILTAVVLASEEKAAEAGRSLSSESKPVIHAGLARRFLSEHVQNFLRNGGAEKTLEGYSALDPDKPVFFEAGKPMPIGSGLSKEQYRSLLDGLLADADKQTYLKTLASRVSIGDKVRLENGEVVRVIRILEGEVTFVRPADHAAKEKISRRELEKDIFDGRAGIVSGARLAVAGHPDYQRSYFDALLHYREWAPEDRFNRNLISRSLTKALALEREEEFREFFTDIALVIHESEGRLEIGDLSVLLKDIADFRPELKQRLTQYLIRLALVSEKSVPHAIVTAIKTLRGMEIGEVVLISPETIAGGSSGGLAIAVTELAEALAELGIHVTVVTPLFAKAKKNVTHHYGLTGPRASVDVKLGSHGEETQNVAIYPLKIGRVHHLLLENPEYFDSLNDDDGRSAYKGDMRVRMRFARVFSAGALLAIRKMNIHPAVIQLNDHTTAPAVPYLKGRDRIDPEVQGLLADPHFAKTKLMMILHNAEKGYQGRIFVSHNQKYRDHQIRHHLGMDPASAEREDWKVLFLPPNWHEVNPVFMAVEEADHVRTVSPNYHEKSLDPAFDGEFGGLVRALRHRASAGRYDGVLNGIGLVEKQRMLFGMSFFEIGDENQRRAFAKKIFSSIAPVKKTQLQKAFALGEDPDAFLLTMLHRIDRQKGHQLLLMNIFDAEDPDVLKTPAANYREDIFGKIEEIEGQAYRLSDEERAALLEYSREHGRKQLRAVEVAMALWPDLQVIIGGKADAKSDAGRFYDEGFSQLNAWFPRQFRYPGEFINARDDRYSLIYSGSTVFDMPSYFEPGGISNQEAAAFGVVRHTSRRDGLKDGEISFNGVREGFDPYNPVAWFVSLKGLREAYQDKSLYKDTGWTVWDELRYRALTQDNRWLRKAKSYANKYRELAGIGERAGLAALEIGAAVHLAEMKGKNNASDELMWAGFTVSEALEIARRAVQGSRDEAVKASLSAKIPHLERIAVPGSGARLAAEGSKAIPRPHLVRSDHVRRSLLLKRKYLLPRYIQGLKDDRQRLIVKLRTGLGTEGGRRYSFKEIAEKFRSSPGKLGRIYRQALEALRERYEQSAGDKPMPPQLADHREVRLFEWFGITPADAEYGVIKARFHRIVMDRRRGMKDLETVKARLGEEIRELRSSPVPPSGARLSGSNPDSLVESFFAGVARAFPGPRLDGARLALSESEESVPYIYELAMTGRTLKATRQSDGFTWVLNKNAYRKTQAPEESVSLQDLKALERNAVRTTSDLLGTLTLSSDKPVIIKVNLDLIDNPSFGYYLDHFIDAQRSTRNKPYRKNVYFAAESKKPFLLALAKQRGASLFIDDAREEELLKEGASLVHLAPAGLVSSKNAVNIPVKPIEEGEIPSFQALTQLAIAAGRIDLESIPDAFAAAYQTLAGQSLPAGTLSRILKGLADLETVLRYALRPLVKVSIDKAVKFFDLIKRMIEQSA